MQDILVQILCEFVICQLSLNSFILKMLSEDTLTPDCMADLPRNVGGHVAGILGVVRCIRRPTETDL